MDEIYSSQLAVSRPENNTHLHIIISYPSIKHHTRYEIDVSFKYLYIGAQDLEIW
jgi:hypothetical protein